MSLQNYKETPPTNIVLGSLFKYFTKTLPSVWINETPLTINMRIPLSQKIYWLPYAPSYLKPLILSHPSQLIENNFHAKYLELPNVSIKTMSNSVVGYEENIGGDIVVEFLDSDIPVEHVKARIHIANAGKKNASFMMDTQAGHVAIHLRDLSVYINGKKVKNTLIKDHDIVINQEPATGTDFVHNDKTSVITEKERVVIIVANRKTF